MSYFPAFLKLDNKKVLIVGGGKIASDKIGHILDFTSDISIIAPEISAEISRVIKDKNLSFKQREYMRGDIKGFDIVVIAINDIPLQAEIFEESKEYKCLCNSVDSTDYCDFIFGSYIKKDDLTVAISTSGASPAVAKHLKRYLQELIPSTIGEFLKEMRELRTTLPKGKQRMKMLDEKAKKYINSWSRK